MRKCERQYYEEQLELNRNDLRRSWKITKEIIRKNNSYETSSIKCFVNGYMTKDSTIIANAFNDFL